MKLILLSTLVLLLASVSARVGDVGRQLEISQIRHRKLRRATEDQRIEGQFIIVLNDAVDNIVQYALQLIGGSGAELKYEYETVLKGFVVDKVVADLLLVILDDSMVKYVAEVSSFRLHRIFHSSSSSSHHDKYSSPDRMQ